MTDQKSTIDLSSLDPDLLRKYQSIVHRIVETGEKVTVRSVRARSESNNAEAALYLNAVKSLQAKQVSDETIKLANSRVGELIAAAIANTIEDRTSQIREEAAEVQRRHDDLLSTISDDELEWKRQITTLEAESHAAKESEKRTKIELSTLENELKLALKTSADEKSALAKQHEQRIESFQELQQQTEKHFKQQITDLESDKERLQDQVNSLLVNEAKYQMQESQLVAMRQSNDEIAKENATIKTELIEQRATLVASKEETKRLISDLKELRKERNKMSDSQGQLLEVTRQLSQQAQKINALEREKETLATALSAKSGQQNSN